MNLNHHLGIMWKFRWVTLAGLTLGLALAFVAAYDVSNSSKLERRGTEEWSAESRIMVTQAGFPEGRVTLPFDSFQPGAQESQPVPRGERSKKLKFAPPDRFSSLALLYSSIAIGDEVRSKLPGPPAPEQIQAEALDATGNRTQFLPIIRLTTIDDSAAGAQRLNAATYAALKDLLQTEQSEAGIKGSERIVLNMVNSPQATLVKGPSWTSAILALMLCLLATLALVHVLEALSLRRTAATLLDARERNLPATVPVELPPMAGSGRRGG